MVPAEGSTESRWGKPRNPRGLEFLRPFFLGEREHIEFAGTTVSFDIDRREAGYAEFRDAPFNPARARVLLRLARVAFPEVRDWTEQIVDAAYDPRTKLLAAIHGEPRCRAAWVLMQAFLSHLDEFAGTGASAFQRSPRSPCMARDQGQLHCDSDQIP